MILKNLFLNTILLGAIVYGLIIFVLKFLEKRILFKWNYFDFIVTIAFGSILASILFLTEDSLEKGILGFILLVFFQYSLTWIAVRSSWGQKLVKANYGNIFPKLDVLRKTNIV